MTYPTPINPEIVLIEADTGLWFIMSLQILLAHEDGIDATACTEAMCKGETWLEGGGAAPAAYIVNLDHRDTPNNFPSRAVAVLAYEAFCFHHDLPHIDAQENHTQQMLLSNHEHIDNTAIVNWLGAFCDAYDNLEG